jgi:hypothetical protein
LNRGGEPQRRRAVGKTSTPAVQPPRRTRWSTYASGVGSQVLWTLVSQNHSTPSSCRRMTAINCPISPSSVQPLLQGPSRSATSA